MNTDAGLDQTDFPFAKGALPAEMPQPTGAARIQKFQVSIPQAVQLAMQQFEQGKRADAESICLQILAAEPEQPEALHICGALAHLAGKNGLALALLEKSVRLNPDNVQSQYNLGVVFGACRMFDSAARHYRAALAIQPSNISSLQNLGNIALEADQFSEAQSYYVSALALAPDNAILHLSLAMAHTAQRHIELARASFERALQLDPGNVRIQWEAAQLLLLQCEFVRGWEFYEARFPAGNDCKVWKYPFPFPDWRGESLAGRHLLVHGEQGLGDEIMFLSIVPELLAEGAIVSIVGQPHLHSLWRHVFPQCASFIQLRANEDQWTKVVPDWIGQLGTVTPPVDFQIPFGTLPLIRRRSSTDFARQSPYIRAEVSRAERWAAWLAERIPRKGPEERSRIGLVWAGNPAPNNVIANRKDAKRSIALKDLGTLGSLENFDWVSLQAWHAAAQIREWGAPLRLVDTGELLTDFMETVALIANLDLVISVDTSVCHLAAAMGKPVWILLPFIGEWRWGLHESRAHWWPSARLFRQRAPGDWNDVIERVRVALSEFGA